MWPHLHQPPSKDKSVRQEVFQWLPGGGVSGKRDWPLVGVWLLWGGSGGPEIIVMMHAQLCEHTKHHPSVHCQLFKSGWIVWDVNYISIKPLIFKMLCCAVLSNSVVSDSWWPHGLQPARLLCPWNSQARILEGVTMPRDRTEVSHIAGGSFTIWATREAQEHWSA